MNGHDSGIISGVYTSTSISYIGNNKDGNEPFGYICDLRIYPKVLDLS